MCDFLPWDLEPVARFVLPTLVQRREWINQTHFVLSRELCEFLRMPFAAESLEQRWHRAKFRYTGELSLAQQAFIVHELLESDPV